MAFQKIMSKKDLKQAENSPLRGNVSEIKRKPGRPKGRVVKGILPKYRKEGMIELLNWRDKGFFGKKENISIHELADKGAEWGLFLSDSNTPLSAKTIEIELGEIWRGEHLQKVMEKKSKNKNKDKK